jgi:hypothetical protein
MSQAVTGDSAVDRIAQPAPSPIPTTSKSWRAPLVGVLTGCVGSILPRGRRLRQSIPLPLSSPCGQGERRGEHRLPGFGDGPVDLVFVPGFISRVSSLGGAVLARFLRRLGAFTRVIFFDKRGLGCRSGRAPSWPGRADG